MSGLRKFEFIAVMVAAARFCLAGAANGDGPVVAKSADEKKVLLAKTPPMGWNSWDGYGTTVNEEQVRANAKWVAEHLKKFGWEYVVVDMEWYVTNPIPEGNSKTFSYAMDGNGRYIPAEN